MKSCAWLHCPLLNLAPAPFKMVCLEVVLTLKKKIISVLCNSSGEHHCTSKEGRVEPRALKLLELFDEAMWTGQARQRGAKAHFFCYLKVIFSFIWTAWLKDIHSWTCLILKISELFSFEWVYTLVSSFHYMDLSLLTSGFMHLDFSNQARMVDAEWVSLGSLIGLSVYEAESK